MSGRHDPHVQRDRAAADPLHDPLLENSKQQHLGFRRQFTDFVQQDCTAVGQLEPSDPSPGGACERSCLVAEQFTGDHARRQGGATHSYERMVTARAQLVDGPGDEFFARSGFPEDQDGTVGWGNLTNGRPYGSHGGSVAGQRSKVAVSPGFVAPIRRLPPIWLQRGYAGGQLDDAGVAVAAPRTG
jgi:hypothetical protein